MSFVKATKISPSFTSNIDITNTLPKISLVDTDNNDDFDIKNQNGIFIIAKSIWIKEDGKDTLDAFDDFEEFYEDKESNEDSKSDARVALVLVICFVAAALFWVSGQ